MANDIFNRNVSTLGGVFTSDRAKLTLPQGLSTLVQQMAFTYAQTITRLYEVGGSNIYYVGGRTQGQLNINRVVGPSGTICAMYTRYGDVCKARNNAITLTLEEVDCSSGDNSNQTEYEMRNCVITQVGISVAAQDMIINENVTMMYSSLEANGPGCAGTSGAIPVPDSQALPGSLDLPQRNTA